MAWTPSIGTFATSAGAQTLNPSTPGGAASSGDFVGVICYANDDINWSIQEAGFSKSEISSAVAGDKTTALFTKKAGASEPTSYNVDISGGVNKVLKAAVFTIPASEIDSTTWLDATPVALDMNQNSDTATPPDITTVTNDALVGSVCGAVQTTSATPATQPSGYTKLGENGTTHYLGIAWVNKATAGVESPGDWSGLGTGADSAGVTFAVRPAAGGGRIMSSLVGGGGLAGHGGLAGKGGGLAG